MIPNRFHHVIGTFEDSIMGNNRILLSITLASVFAATPLAAATLRNTFGNVVTTVGGHPADIALDEPRGQLYIANSRHYLLT